MTNLKITPGPQNPDTDIRLHVGRNFVQMKRSDLFQIADFLCGYVETGVDQTVTV